MSEIEKKIAEYKDKINSCLKVRELDLIKSEVLGKSGLINSEFKKLSSLPTEEKKLFAANINKIKQDLSDIFKLKLVEILDKDIIASEIAKSINAKLLIVTNVPGVFNNFRSTNQTLIPEMTLEDAYYYLETHFDDSSMWPKILAAANHAEDGGMTVITDFYNAMKILETGKVDGTQATVVAPVKGPNAA